MSEEERKIRGVIENDIERDSEEEIKDGICHLAVRLHRLYQHRRERKAQNISESGDKKDKTLSEVNISIKMEGGTKVEIKEITKKEAADHRKGLPLPPRSSRSNNANVQAMRGFNAKKFDWAKSLRAGTDPAVINRKIERSYSYQAKIRSCDRGFRMNLNLHNTRRNLASASGLRKGNTGLSNKVLELGWKC